MNAYVGKHPILNTHDELVGYELLYRSSERNVYDAHDGNYATAEVLINSFINIGIRQLTNGLRCFVNFTEYLLNKHVPFCFPKHLLVVEILESVPYSDRLLDVCERLKRAGYTIALDDFVFHDNYVHLFPYIDIIKIDFSRPNNLHSFKHYIHTYGIQLLAEKIETSEQLALAKQQGFSYFQGYFFSKPIVIKEKKLPNMSKIAHFSFLKYIHSNEAHFDTVVCMIENDPTLTYRLLKTVNSFFLSSLPKIQSIRHAATLLGMNGLRRWLTVLLLQPPGDPFANEMIAMSLIRAKMLERLALLTNIPSEKEKLFLMGICSMLPLLLDKPLTTILNDLQIHNDIQKGLLGNHSVFSKLFNLVIALEVNDCEEIERLAWQWNIPVHTLLSSYQQCIEWVVHLQQAGLR